MIHPLFSLFINRPDLVVEHAAAYAALVRQEASTAGAEVARRAIAWGITALCFSVFGVLAGTALMLGTLMSQFHWVLLAVPVVSLALALVALRQARRPLSADHFNELKSQLDADAATLRQAGGQA
ncbi:MAG: phage holin family protein [Ramlibacter sp.]|nr:phage holin family protein [Ramlibacter sp.]